MNARSRVALLCCALLAACSPPATDQYAARDREVAQTDTVLPPIASPDTTNAVWAPTQGDAEAPERVVFGEPGTPPLFALACSENEDGPVIRLTRFNTVEDGAQALIAVIGNGHIARWKVDATPRGSRNVWEGDVPLEDEDLEMFAGPRRIEATVPGGGSLELPADPLPARLIARCIANAEAQGVGEEEAATEQDIAVRD